MKQYASVKTSGEISYISSENSEFAASITGDTFIEIPDGISPEETLNHWVYKDGWHKKTERPSTFHVWNIELMEWEDPRTLDELKDFRWLSAKMSDGAIGDKELFYDGNFYDVNESAIMLACQSAMLSKTLSQEFSIEWTLRDNTRVTLDADGVIGLSLALHAYISARHKRLQDFREKVYAAQDKLELKRTVF